MPWATCKYPPLLIISKWKRGKAVCKDWIEVATSPTKIILFKSLKIGTINLRERNKIRGQKSNDKLLHLLKCKFWKSGVKKYRTKDHVKSDILPVVTKPWEWLDGCDKLVHHCVAKKNLILANHSFWKTKPKGKLQVSTPGPTRMGQLNQCVLQKSCFTLSILDAVGENEPPESRTGFVEDKRQGRPSPRQKQVSGE